MISDVKSIESTDTETNENLKIIYDPQSPRPNFRTKVRTNQRCRSLRPLTNRKILCGGQTSRGRSLPKTMNRPQKVPGKITAIPKN